MSWENIEILDPRMKDLLLPDSRLERHCTGAVWSEGPVYFSEGDYILWSDIPNNRMLRWSQVEGMSVYREPSNFTNGHTRDREGRLVSCEHGGRRISRTEPDGSVVCVVDNYQGKKLNSPNDVVVKSDGTIWFTDPPYGIMSNEEGYQAESEIGANYVYRFDPAKEDLSVVADDFDKPNGLAFSPDESLLYISDTGASHDPEGAHHIRVFDVINGKSLANGRVFAVVDPGLADGFRLDTHGNLYTSSEDSIQVYTAAGDRIGKILVPEKIANCTFGGPEKNRLFIVASSSLYSITLNTRGVQQP
ncbi:SMP-30/gluconolactonase/LRE family protein [Denitrobaculum tricleocarpae]|uniref:SMP-30/gluconolactonase/LRE family protein n=1 Tax=Denitrobaculum tricleocarpae TaxID=2591009 RepID=A0A545TAX8_9PROT|nr:SMP-30/gluconolactonase/LRE family protein [Denitrobaculum tricleocarpae]TQV74369.1 SMP-30/gluconolactonase/LRE family protein [Denitrobaculum tricleocarpae]